MALKEKQDELIDWFIDNQKRDYLQKGEDFGSCIIAFHDDQATLFPFEAQDNRHKDVLLMALAGMFAAKDVKRYLYFMDTFVAEGIEEAAIWGVVNDSGIEWHQVQFHDSKTHTFLTKVLPVDEQKHNIFTKIIEQAKRADFSRLPELKGHTIDKANFWELGMYYFKSLGTEPLQFQLAEGVK